MINILKLKQGKNISKLEYELAIADYNLAYQQADDDMKAKLDGLMLSSKSFSSADPMNNRSAREYATQIYRNASKIARGEYAEAPGALTSTKNIFNGYSHRENIDNANYVTSRYLLKNSVPKVLQAAPVASKNNSNLYHRYNWANGLSSGWTLDTDTLEDRMNSFASTLSDNLNSALSAKNSGKKLVGVDENNVEVALGMLQGKQWTRDNFKDLMKVAQLAGVDPGAFRDYFGDLFPGVSAEEKAKKVWTDKGYNEVDISGLSEGVKAALNSNNVRLLKDKDNNYILAGKDWSEYSGNGFNWIDLNQGDTYGHGILAGTDGKVFIGNTANINDSHWANELFSGIKNKMYELYNPIYTRKKFNLNNDYSDENLINTYIRGLESAGYKNSDASYTDVSKLFNGTSKVIAYNPDGSELGTGSFGELILSPNTQFIWENADGTISKPSTLEEAKRALGGFNLKGYDTEANEQLGALTDLSNVFEGAEGINGDTKLRSTNWKHSLTAGLGTAGAGAGIGTFVGGPIGAAIGAGIGFLTGSAADLIAQFYNNDTIQNKPQAFVDAAVQALKDPSKKIDIPGIADLGMTGSEFLAQFGTRTQLLETIGRFVNEGAKLSPQDLRWIKNMYYTAEKTRLDSEAKTRKHAEGGILYAADGTALFVNQEKPTNNWHEKYDKSRALKKEDADIAAAKADGYDDVNKWRANKSTTLTIADAFRFATMAQDTASIVASFMPGAGTGVAAGLGVTALGTDLVADIMDPAVSAGEVIKNAGMNAGFAALGMIPGAKMTKVVKNIVKYAPKIITAAAGLGIAMDESTQNTFKKITSGTEKLNREDWRNLSHVLSLVAAGTRGIKGDIARMKVSKSNVPGENVKLKGIKTAEGKDIELPKNQVKEINAKLAKATTPEEIAAIREEYQLPEEAIKAPMIKEGKLAGKYKLVETVTTENESASYDNLRTIWNKEAKDVRNSSNLGRWFANKVGGGAYTAKQRAILELSSENETLANALAKTAYKGSYNSMIDWEGLRSNTGTKSLSARQPVLDQFTNVSEEARAAHRAELAQFAKNRRAEIREKVGVNKAQAAVEENERGIAGLERAINGNDVEISNARQQIDQANIELGKIINEKRNFSTESRVAKSGLTRANKELNKAISATELAIGEKLTLKKGRYVSKKTYTKEQKDLIANLNRLLDRKNSAAQKVTDLPLRAQLISENKAAIESRIREYNKRITDLENEQLGGIRSMQKREADIPRLQQELKARQERAHLFNGKIQSEVNSKGVKLEGEVAQSVRVSGQSIKKGATVTSYEHLRNVSAMPPAGFNKLKLEAVSKTFPGLKNLRGAAYNPATNEMIIWENGGKINSKYSHLRK